MPSVNTDSTLTHKLGPKPICSSAPGTGGRFVTKTPHRPSQSNGLNRLNKSPAVDAISPVQGSRQDHSFYICRLCYPKLTHIMNIGATLHHITHDHYTDRYNHRDKLTQEASGHLAEIRHLLQQTNNRRVFSLIRSSLDSLPIITWRGNSANSDIKSITMDRKWASTSGSPPRERNCHLPQNCSPGPPQIEASKSTKFRQQH
jgi:hypothetical protein